MHPRCYGRAVPKVIQIRDVPDDVHAALAEAAEAEGVSLTSYARRELAHVARRREAVRHNAEVVRDTQDRVRGRVGRDAVLAALHEGRRD